MDFKLFYFVVVGITLISLLSSAIIKTVVFRKVHTGKGLINGVRKYIDAEVLKEEFKLKRVTNNDSTQEK